MFHDLVKIGKAVMPEGATEFEVFLDSIGENYTYGIAIDFKTANNTIIYSGLHTESFDGSKHNEIKYKFGSSRGYDYLPSSKLAPKKAQEPVSASFKKTFANRILPFLQDISETSKGNSKITSLKMAFESNLDNMLKDLEIVYPPNNERAFVYLNLDGDYLWDDEDFRNFYLEKVSHSCKFKDKSQTYNENGSCFLCEKVDTPVYGNVSNITCYNLDQPGMVAGGAFAEMGVKNLPICLECTGSLLKGFDFITNNLDFYMGSSSYLLIPVVSDEKYLKTSIEKFDKKTRKNYSLSYRELGNLTGKEEKLLRLIAKEHGDKDDLKLRMVFYRGSNAKWRITGEINQVLPSRLKSIFETKKKVQEPYFYKKDGDKVDHVSMFLFKAISTRVPDPTSKQGKESGEKSFLEYVEAIFGGKKKLSYKNVLRDIVARILLEHKKAMNDKNDEWRRGYYTRHSFMILNFLKELNIIELEEGDKMTDELDIAGEYKNFLDEYSDFFGSPGKRVAFLTGALISNVLRYGPKSEPFRRYLGDYKFEMRDLEKIRAKAEAKLAAYDRQSNCLTYTRKLRTLLDNEWAKSGSQWPDSEDELTLSTIMGMNLRYAIEDINRQDKKEQE